MNFKEMKIGETITAENSDDKAVKTIMDKLHNIDMLAAVLGDTVIKAIRNPLKEALKNLEHAYPKINPHGTNLYK